MSDRDTPQDDVAQGIEHLQTAAREVIRAARSLLDAAEGLVEDPQAVQGLVGTLSTLAGVAAARLRTTDGGGDGDGGPARVQRIDLS